MNRLCRLSLIVLTALGTTFPSAGLAQAVDSPTRSTPYKIAIFPFAGDFDFDKTREGEIAAISRNSIQEDRSLVLAYSYYDDALNDPPIKRPARLWGGNEINKKPNLERVYAMARERGVHGVVMWWGGRAMESSTFADVMPPDVEVYLIDVNQKKVYYSKGTIRNTRKLIRRVFADFAKSRPQAVASAAPSQAVTRPATRTGAYKIAIFPFESEETSQYRPSVDAAISDKLSKFIQSDSSFTLVYSFDSDGYSRDRVPKTDKLWVGGAVRKKPNLALLYATARELGVDGIVMAFREGYSWGSPDPEGWTLELYLIDVDRQQVHYRKGRIRNTRKLIRGVFADFAKSRPPVVASIKQQRVAPPAQPIKAQAGDWTINYCKDLTVDEFHKAAIWAFQKRKYTVEEDTPSSLTGAQQGKKVEVSMTAPGHIVIRWVPGFGYHKDNWLKNIKYDVLWGLAGAAQTGEWSINWCKDLTVDEFHKAAKWALRKKKYAIEEDTPSSLTGAQKGKKVEITMTAPGQIVIRWVPGFGYEKDDWLKYLWREVSVWLAQ